MSDDGYYAGSPYDDFEDLLWDADPTPDLADDLAEHAAHSPVWQDDPVGELNPYHSDWEYYSDDYYDDDPALLQQEPIHRTLGSVAKNTEAPKSRGRKRKLDEARSNSNSQENISLSHCIKGTVWARKIDEEVVTFKRGEQKGVALLTNWRNISDPGAQGALLFGQGQLKDDESWAKDLSLADMGLLSGQKQASMHASLSETAEADDNTANLDDDDDDSQLLDDVEPLDELMDEDTSHHAIEVVTGPDDGGLTDDAKHERFVPRAHVQYDEVSTLSKKRRRESSFPSPPHSSRSSVMGYISAEGGDTRPERIPLDGANSTRSIVARQEDDLYNGRARGSAPQTRLVTDKANSEQKPLSRLAASDMPYEPKSTEASSPPARRSKRIRKQ